MQEKFMGIGKTYHDLEIPENCCIKQLRFVIVKNYPLDKDKNWIIRNLEFGNVLKAFDPRQGVKDCADKVIQELKEWPIRGKEGLSKKIADSFCNKTNAKERVMDNYLFNKTLFLLETNYSYYNTKFYNIKEYL